MIRNDLNRYLPFGVPAWSMTVLLIGMFFTGGCSVRDDRSAIIPQNSEQPVRWYRQAIVDLGSRIRMFSTQEGIAVSRGMGRDVRGKAYRFRNGEWFPILDYPYSDYPLISQIDSTDLWIVNHLTHEGAYRPVLTEFRRGVQRNIMLPKVMWDEIDHAMMKGIHRFPDGTAWMVGQQGHILYYDGAKWIETESPLIHKERVNVYDGDLNDIAMTSVRSGWAVGRNGIIIRYQFGRWTKVESPTGQTLQKIAMLNDSTGWAVGNSGTILRCTNFRWENFRTDVREQFSSVTVIDDQQAWIVGNNSTLLSFDGIRWNQDESIKQYDDFFADISVVKDTSGVLHMWIIGNQGIYTTSQSLGFSFTDITNQSGLRRTGKLGIFLNSDNNSLPDLLVANDGGSSMIYSNAGGGRFTDITTDAGLVQSPKDAVAFAVGDVNEDGEEDIFQLIDHRSFALYLGSSFGAYRDFTERSQLQFDEIPPLTPISAKFIDLNYDGHLDLYISNYDHADQVFSGDGTGRFQRVTAETGIAKILNHASYGASFGDLNADGRIDILLPYYVSSKGKFFSLFLNEGNFRFSGKDQPLFYSAADLSPTAVTLSDLNNDGHLDVYIHSQKVPPMLWINDGNANFSDRSTAAGFVTVNVHPEPINGIVGSADVNNDGRMDIFDGSRLFLNSPGLQFTEVSERIGIQFIGTPSFSDVDEDGDVDLFIGSSRSSLGKGDRAALFRNNLDEHNFIKIRLDASGISGSVIGAKVILRGSDSTLVSMTVGTGGNQMTNGTQNDLLFGARPGVVYTAEALFPSGIVVNASNIISGDRITIAESNFFSSLVNTFIRSGRRTVRLLGGVMIALYSVILLLIASLLVTAAKFLQAQKIVRHWIFWCAVLSIFLTAVHFTVYADRTLSILFTFFGTFTAASAGLVSARHIVNKREARYISHFRIMELLGAGGMGKVYKAVDSETKRTVALKVLNPELLKDPENRRRLSAEGHLLASFSHPNIVKVFEIGESNERGFIAMEYLEGGTLGELLERQKELSLPSVKEYLLQICSGLEEVHSKGIVHRDLKTANVMLGSDGNVRIMDFGLSKSPLVTTMTSLGTVLGTLGYVAPEQVTSLDVDRRTDIFSLGVIMYELLTGQLPFKGENEIALIHSIFNTTPALPSTLRDDVPAQWDSIVMKCLSKDMNERYSTAEDVRQALTGLKM